VGEQKIMTYALPDMVIKCHCGYKMSKSVGLDEVTDYECANCGDCGEQHGKLGPIFTHHGWEYDCKTCKWRELSSMAKGLLKKAFKVDFVDWFDPDNIYHILAYNHLCHEGCWPKDFIPKNCFMRSGWSLRISNKLASAWVGHMMKANSQEVSKEK
jgi:hypothetical protein